MLSFKNTIRLLSWPTNEPLSGSGKTRYGNKLVKYLVGQVEKQINKYWGYAKRIRVLLSILDWC